MASDQLIEIKEALKKIKNVFGEATPETVVTLGSGLGAFADHIAVEAKIPYTEIPGFEAPKVPGHNGQAIVGNIGKHRLLIFQGRFHYYEGHALSKVTLPTRVAGAWGIENFVVTNAAGGLHKKWTPGSLMLITDHINFMGHNPLRGPNLDNFGERFFDMTNAYDAEYQKQVKEIAKKFKHPTLRRCLCSRPGSIL